MATKLFDTTIVAPRKGVRTLFCGWTVSAVAREQHWGQRNLTPGPSTMMNVIRRSAAS